ncbi:MAG: DUF4258 domain-containing protein [Traorella sp.]
MNNIYLTNHAYERLKERAGINRKAAKRMCIKAYESGIDETDVTGSLKKYMFSKGQGYEREGYTSKIYGNFVYCFHNESNAVVLITAFWVPKSLKNQSLAAQRRKLS